MSHECTKVVDHSYVKVEEKGRRAVFKNPSKSQFRVTAIDGCLIKDNDARADHLVSRIGSASALIELKGCDVQHACEQLLGTVVRPEVIPLLEGRFGFLVVCRKYPSFDTFVMKAKQIAMKKYKAGFHVVCGEGEFEIERIADINGPR